MFSWKYICTYEGGQDSPVILMFGSISLPGVSHDIASDEIN